jgi:hypothetical protein
VRGPSAADLVRLWEAGAAASGVERGVLLLSAAAADPHDDLAALSIGERDRQLLKVRERLFGAWLHSVADCPRCGIRLQFTLDLRDLCAGTTGELAAPHVDVTDGDLRLRVRPPNSHDLAVIADCDDVMLAKRVLAERCVVDVSKAGVPILPSDLPDRALTTVAAAMTAADPGADLVLDLRCEACEERWPLALDIVMFVWQEIESVARRVLNEVHELAWAYGWGEADILGMSDARRRHYLALVR